MKSNLSQEHVAQMLNVTLQTVSKWENGRSIPDISSLVPIASLFHISVDELLGSEDRRRTLEAAWKKAVNSQNMKEELQILHKALREFPGDYRFRYRLALIEFRMAKTEADPVLQKRFLILADIQLESLLKEQPEYVDAADLHVLVLAALDRKGEARKLAELSPNRERLLLAVLQDEELVAQKKRIVKKGVFSLLKDLLSEGSLSALNIASLIVETAADSELQLSGFMIEVLCRKSLLYRENGEEQLAETTLIEAKKLAVHSESFCCEDVGPGNLPLEPFAAGSGRDLYKLLTDERISAKTAFLEIENILDRDNRHHS